MLSACTGGPRPTLTEDNKFEQPQAGLPFINSRYLLGPLDTIRLTFYLIPDTIKEEYRLQAGDLLLLEIHQYEHLNRNLPIRPDGRVTLPFVGEVMAAGQTTQELSKTIKKRLRKIYQDPEVTLSVVQFNSYYRQIQEALGNTSGTRQRLDLTIDVNGSLRVPLCPRVCVAGRTTEWLEDQVQANFSMLGGNVDVVVDILEARSNRAYVLGEVNRPGVVEMRSQVTVTQAIAMAGGYKDTAGLSSVVLVRPDENYEPVAKILNIENVLAKGNICDDMIVQRYDIIYVPPSLVTKLNQAVLYGIRNNMPLESSLGFTYVWGNQRTFQPINGN